MIKYSVSHMRLVADKVYVNSLFSEYARFLTENLSCKVSCVHYGKLDARGSLSISVFDDKDCVPYQRHFGSKEALVAFVEGALKRF